MALAAAVFLYQLSFHQAPKGPAPQLCWVRVISQLSRQLSCLKAVIGMFEGPQQRLSKLLAVLNQHRVLAAVTTTARLSHLTHRQQQGLLAAIRAFRNQFHPPQLASSTIAALPHRPGQTAAIAIGIEQQRLRRLAITAGSA